MFWSHVFYCIKFDVTIKSSSVIQCPVLLANTTHSLENCKVRDNGKLVLKELEFKFVQLLYMAQIYKIVFNGKFRWTGGWEHHQFD